MRLLLVLILLCPCFFASAEGRALASESQSLSDDKIKDKIIEQSVASYPGRCPCPDFVDRAGRRCGKRSAYSKPGGYAPKCYRSDITPSEISAYRNKR